MTGQIINACRRRIVLEIRRRSTSEQLNREKATRHNLRSRRIAGLEAKIDPVGDHVRCAIFKYEIKGDARVDLAECSKQGNQDSAAYRTARADADKSFVFVRRVLDAIHRGAQSIHAFADGFQQSRSFFGKRTSARGPMKESHAKMLFELPNGFADSLRRHAMRVCGLIKTTAFGCSNEYG